MSVQQRGYSSLGRLASCEAVSVACLLYFLQVEDEGNNMKRKKIAVASWDDENEKNVLSSGKTTISPSSSSSLCPSCCISDTILALQLAKSFMRRGAARGSVKIFQEESKSNIQKQKQMRNDDDDDAFFFWNLYPDWLLSSMMIFPPTAAKKEQPSPSSPPSATRTAAAISVNKFNPLEVYPPSFLPPALCCHFSQQNRDKNNFTKYSIEPSPNLHSFSSLLLEYPSWLDRRGFRVGLPKCPKIHSMVALPWSTWCAAAGNPEQQKKDKEKGRSKNHNGNNKKKWSGGKNGCESESRMVLFLSDTANHCIYSGVVDTPSSQDDRVDVENCSVIVSLSVFVGCVGERGYANGREKLIYNKNKRTTRRKAEEIFKSYAADEDDDGMMSSKLGAGGLEGAASSQEREREEEEGKSLSDLTNGFMDGVRFNSPRGISLLANGKYLLICDQGNGELRALDFKERKFFTLAGNSNQFQQKVNALMLHQNKTPQTSSSSYSVVGELKIIRTFSSPFEQMQNDLRLTSTYRQQKPVWVDNFSAEEGGKGRDRPPLAVGRPITANSSLNNSQKQQKKKEEDRPIHHQHNNNNNKGSSSNMISHRNKISQACDVMNKFVEEQLLAHVVGGRKQDRGEDANPHLSSFSVVPTDGLAGEASFMYLSNVLEMHLEWRDRTILPPHEETNSNGHDGILRNDNFLTTTTTAATCFILLDGHYIRLLQMPPSVRRRTKRRMEDSKRKVVEENENEEDLISQGEGAVFTLWGGDTTTVVDPTALLFSGESSQLSWRRGEGEEIGPDRFHSRITSKKMTIRVDGPNDDEDWQLIVFDEASGNFFEFQVVVKNVFSATSGVNVRRSSSFVEPCSPIALHLVASYNNAHGMVSSTSFAKTSHQKQKIIQNGKNNRSPHISISPSFLCSRRPSASSYWVEYTIHNNSKVKKNQKTKMNNEAAIMIEAGGSSGGSCEIETKLQRRKKRGVERGRNVSAFPFSKNPESCCVGDNENDDERTDIFPNYLSVSIVSSSAAAPSSSSSSLLPNNHPHQNIKTSVAARRCFHASSSSTMFSKQQLFTISRRGPDWGKEGNFQERGISQDDDDDEKDGCSITDSKMTCSSISMSHGNSSVRSLTQQQKRTTSQQPPITKAHKSSWKNISSAGSSKCCTMAGGASLFSSSASSPGHHLQDTPCSDEGEKLISCWSEEEETDPSSTFCFVLHPSQTTARKDIGEGQNPLPSSSSRPPLRTALLCFFSFHECEICRHVDSSAL